MGINELIDHEAREYRRMARGHAKLWSWGLSHLKLFSPLDIIDLGCGDGRNVDELLRMFPQAKVSGVDISPKAVTLAKKRNQRDIITKRCQILEENVNALSFSNESSDLVTAFETVYFWPGPMESFQEVYRVLMPNGIFMIVNKIDGEEDALPHWTKSIDGLITSDKMTLIRALKGVGFNEFSVDHLKENHWLCILARK